MADEDSRLAINEYNASEDAEDDWDAVWLIADTDVTEVFLVEAGGLEVGPVCAQFMTNLRDDCGFPGWFRGFETVWFLSLGLI